MAFNYKCEDCGKDCVTNTKFIVECRGKKRTVCPICVLGEEGKQSKYWETGSGKNAGHPEGFRYSDDTVKYNDHWDSKAKKWVKNNSV